VWVAGAAGQAVAAALIVLAALTLEGAAAGWAICTALAGLAVSRALCSVSFKDILGRTVGQTRRGAVTGFASSAASVGVLAFALLLIAGLAQDRVAVVIAIALAAACWAAAAILFSFLDEPRADPEEGQGVDLQLLRDNPLLWRFILVRGLLVSTALAPPYLVVLGGGEDGALGRLGALVLASAVASFLSSWIWGRFADRSSRKVLMATGVLGGAAMVAALGLAWAGLAQTLWAMPAALFVLMVAYHGVRQGRSTYLVDIAPEEARAAWAAVANTLIGLVLLGIGAVAGGISVIGAAWGLGLLAVMAFCAAVAALWLQEAEQG
ncbi:MFS transporter, partial [Aquicoccus sp. SCR17]|nr:MFS transporter [Carideicomes alvinocaridis]